MCPDFRSDDVRVAGEEVDLGVAGEEDNRLTGDGAEEVGLESFGLKSQKLPESSETEKKLQDWSRDYWENLCHGRIRLRMRIVQVALSFFPDTQTSKVQDYLKKLSRGEICVTNFMPPANGASLGSYFCVKNLIIA